MQIYIVEDDRALAGGMAFTLGERDTRWKAFFPVQRRAKR